MSLVNAVKDGGVAVLELNAKADPYFKYAGAV